MEPLQSFWSSALSGLRVSSHIGRVVDVAYGGEEQQRERSKDADRADEKRCAQPDRAPQDAPEGRAQRRRAEQQEAAGGRDPPEEADRRQGPAQAHLGDRPDSPPR